MRITIFAFFILLISWYQGFSQIAKPFAVVELFTSEGCSSCPAAEKVLSDIHADAEKNQKNIFCLEYHVDYWNRLGWKDPYSSFQNTNRQKNYTSVLNEEGIYTPMMVVNGQTAFTGSDAAKAKSSTDAAIAVAGSLQLKMKIDSMERDSLFVSVQSSKTDINYYIRVAITEDQLVSKVGKGENAGRTLTHDHVVRVFFSGEIKNMASQLKIPLKKFVPNKNCELIAFIQHKQTMKILAATKEGF